MSSEKTAADQTRRHRLVTLHFRAFARLARTEPFADPDEISPAMQERVKKIYELHHAIALNHGW